MSLRDLLAAEQTIVLDGGTGSELRRRGLALSADCWSASVNLEHRDLLTTIHRDYLAAGARIVTANTFGGTRFVLAAAGLDARFEAVNRTAIRAAQAAVGEAAVSGAGVGEPARRALVAASMSCMPPGFDRHAWPAAATEYRDYCELAGLFATESVDLVLLEMLQDADHARVACRAVAGTGLPFIAGLSLRLGAGAAAKSARPALVAFDDASLPIEPALDAVLEFEPAAVAIMHTPLDAMLPALELLHTRWTGPIGAWAEIPYPEDPEAKPDAEGRSPERIAPADYAREAERWIDAGARLVGGCCGTMPAHIAALRAMLRARAPRPAPRARPV